jgi:hypothetical protein
MQYRSLLSRSVASFALVTILAVGTHSFAPAVFACGTNAGGGNCKQASHKPDATIDTWSVVQAVFTGLRVFIRL